MPMEIGDLFRTGTDSRVDARQKFPGGHKALKRDGLRELRFGTRPAIRRLPLLRSKKCEEEATIQRELKVPGVEADTWRRR
jgi:hypothetical protein